MKFLKPFKENAQENIVSEIQCIRHIVEDEGLNLYFDEGRIDQAGDFPKGNGIKNYIGVCISSLLNELKTLVGNPHVEEFEDRLLDISISNGYTIKKLKIDTKYGHVVWHIFANKDLMDPKMEMNYEY